MAKHVRVHLDAEIGSLCCSLDHRLKASVGEWRATFADKHEWRFGLTLEPAQGAQFIAG
jgi:hypothetical protein